MTVSVIKRDTVRTLHCECCFALRHSKDINRGARVLSLVFGKHFVDDQSGSVLFGNYLK